MSKIICDVCGTRFPDTSEQCPICGHIREAAGKTAKDVLILDDARPESRKKVPGGRFTKSNVEKRLAGTLQYEEVPVKKTKAAQKVQRDEPVQMDEDIFAEDNQNKKANAILNVLLVIVILALLAVTAFIVFNYILPGEKAPDPTVPPTVMQTEPTEPLETAEPTYPCQELVLEETEVLLTEYEQKWLINVGTKPENTTDELTFTSGNELIATVDSEGCITALAEGQTSITISCGDVSFEYNVVCLFPGVDIKPGEVPTDPPPTEPPEEYKVTTNYVYVRSGPSADYDPLRQHFTGDIIWVYEIKYVGEDQVPWGRLEDGWLCLKYAKKVE